MTKLAKYLRGSLHIILMIVALLALEAWCDLELPDYTSKIVTGGIQQKGVGDPVPEKISAATLENLSLFLSEEDYTSVQEAYMAADENTGSMQEDESGRSVDTLYILRDQSAAGRARLAEIMTDPEVMLLMLTSKDVLANMTGAIAGETSSEESGEKPAQESSDTGSVSQNTSTEADTGQAVSPADMFRLVPDGSSPLEAVKKLPSFLRTGILSGIKETITALPASTREQSAIQFVLSEYEKLGDNLSARQNRYLLRVGARMLLLSLIAMLCTIGVVFLASRLAAGTARTLRKDVYRKVMSFNSEEFHRFSTASLITRSTNDIQQIQMLLAIGLRMLLYAPILGFGALFKVLQTEASITWVIALALALILLLILVLFKIAMPKFTILQSLIDRLNLVSREQLTGIMVTRAFSAEQHEKDRFEKANRDLTGTNLFVNRCMTFMMPIMMLIMNGISVLIVYTGAHEIDRGAMQVGEMMAFIQYAMQIIMAFLMISMMSIIIPRANVAARRIAEVLSTDVLLTDPDVPETPEASVRGQVVFDHVSFAYPDAEENALTDISFTAGRGQTVAFIGSTGSGKSTLVNLIPRFYDVTGGSIQLDGVDVREMTLKDLRSRIGYVPQKSILFSGTIASNISYGRPDASERELAQAAAIAQATEFIDEKEDGYASRITQGGTNVSGGQRQRLSIARAIAKKPELLIFDDSFSALDFKTDAALRKALRETTSDTTVLIVAQRISTIVHADQIIVLDEGKIAGKGTHKQLLETCEVYRQIATSQLSQEELAG